MEAKEIMQSKKVRLGVSVLGCLLIALASFAGGVAVGIHKARFSYRFGENYERNFMGERKGLMPHMKDFEGRGFRNAHGVAGNIIALTGNNLVVKDRDGKENTVAVADQTLIKYHMEDLKLSDLQKGDEIVIIGKPGDNGVVNADIIRVFSRGTQPSSSLPSVEQTEPNAESN